MSGVAGSYSRIGRPCEPLVVERMLDALALRGPDASAISCEGPVALGHRMLANTPEAAHERLPFSDTSNNLAITADARIDNRDELIRSLGLAKHARCGLPDSQIILAAYARWGASCAEHLLGDFAFTIWDGRNQRVYCARDQVGVKPFCYHLSERAFYFASEIKALITVDEVPRRLNKTKVADYLMVAHLSQDSTFFDGICRLPPGHWMLVDQEQHRIQSYWAPDPSSNIQFASDGEYAEAFLSIFEDAVRCRLRSPTPVSALLSGGLDSSSIVCVARQLKRDSDESPLLTYSTVFEPGNSCDETPYIRSVLQSGDCEPRLVAFDHDAHRPIADIRTILQYQDEPVLAPNSSQMLQLLRVVSEDKGRVVLDGHGGDETVSYGNGYLKELARRHRWGQLARELRSSSVLQKRSFLSLLSSYIAFGYEPQMTASQPLRFTRRLWRAGMRRVSRRVRGIAHTAVEPTAIIQADLRRQLASSDRYRQWREQAGAFASEREDHWRTITGPAQPLALETLDARAAALSLEMRFPFWDRRVVEFCLALPPKQKFGGGWGRMILRRSMQGVLPVMVQWRLGKTDFTPNVRIALRRNETWELRRMGKNIDLIADYVDVSEFRSLLQRVESDGWSVQDYFTLSNVATLFYWFEFGQGRLLKRD